MAITIQVHILNEDPIVAEVEALPGPQDTLLVISNASARRQRSALHGANVPHHIFPWRASSSRSCRRAKRSVSSASSAIERCMTPPRLRYRILVVDDEPRMIRFIRLNLEPRLRGGGCRRWAGGAETGARPCHAVLLDGPARVGWFETLRLLREISSVPTIMLTRARRGDDRVRTGLGADDYVTKPFSPRSWSGVKAVLRR
jgi:CheY-like chemotaxis protein